MTSKPRVARVSKSKPSFTGKPYQPTLFGKGRGPKVRPEEAIQISIVQWLNLVAPHLLTFHIPNEGDRSPIAKIFLTKLGMVAGAVDLIILRPEGRCALAEVKAPGKYPTPKQRYFMELAEALGHPTAVLRSIEDTREFLHRIGERTREHLFPKQQQLQLGSAS